MSVSMSAVMQKRLVFSVLAAVALLAGVVSYSLVEAATSFTETKKLTQASPTPGGPGVFGWDVAISGDTAIGTAREPWRFLPPFTVGSASIFERDLGGPGNWGERVKLVPPGTGDVGSVAIDGDTAVVGRDFENSREGAAYIYERDFGGPDNWGLVQRIEDPAGRQNCCDGFGSAVAVSGDTIAVGEFWADRVHIYERNEGGPDNWGHVKTLTGSPDNDQIYDFFFSVSIEGDTLVVGSGNHSHKDSPSTVSVSIGAVYVFERNEGGAGNWGLVKEILAGDGVAGDQFGISTALSGDTLIAGTTGNGQTAAYIFDRNEGGAGNWGEVKKIVGDDVTGGSTAVGLSGDVAVLGHVSHIHPAPPSWGTAFVFERNEGGSNNWGQTQELIPSDPGDAFAGSVAIDCGTIVVGDTSDNALFSDSGAVYVFEDPTAPTSCGGGVTEVAIDIKPGSDVNPINPKSKGVIPVAILTTDDFDATTVDVSSVAFGPDGASEAHGKGHFEDVDGDGDTDLVMHFKTQDAGIASGDEEACLTGVADGKDITGCDVVRVK